MSDMGAVPPEAYEDISPLPRHRILPAGQASGYTTLGAWFRESVDVRRFRLDHGFSIPEVPCRICGGGSANPEPYCDAHLPF